MMGRHCSRVQIGRRPGVDADAAVNRVDADLIIGGADGHGPTRVEIPRITVGQSLVKPPAGDGARLVRDAKTRRLSH